MKDISIFEALQRLLIFAFDIINISENSEKQIIIEFIEIVLGLAIEKYKLKLDAV